MLLHTKLSTHYVDIKIIQKLGPTEIQKVKHFQIPLLFKKPTNL